MIALIFALSAQAACPAPVSPAALDEDIEAVLAAYRRLDEAALARASEALDAALPCVVEPLSATQAARWHAAAALIAIGREDSRRAQAELRALARSNAAAQAEPLVSVSGGAQDLYEQARTAPPRASSAPSLSKGERLWVDGREDLGLSHDVAAVLQLQPSMGGPMYTTSWNGNLSPRRWRAAFEDAPGGDTHLDPGRLVLGGGAAALALGAGAVYGVGLANMARYQDERSTPEERLHYFERSHQVSLWSGGLGLGALGLGAVAVVRW